MTPVLSPENLVNSIPKFISNGTEVLPPYSNIIKEKLLEAEKNEFIFRLARGDGRAKSLKYILDDSILFGWGVKSTHAFLENIKMREFLEPKHISESKIYKLVDMSKNILSKYYYNSPENIDERIELLKAKIKEGSDQERFVLKEFLCSLLHNAQHEQFKDVTPLISTSEGNLRYEKIKFFVKKSTDKYVVLDYWVKKSDENKTFIKTDNINCILAKMGLRWFPNRHNEIMVKYALFPQQLIGYFYYEKNILLHYCVNNHFLKKIQEDLNFKIGDNIYIEQNIDFKTIPFNIIYERSFNRSFSVCARRA